eukprot:g55061.t1
MQIPGVYQLIIKNMICKSRRASSRVYLTKEPGLKYFRQSDLFMISLVRNGGKDDALDAVMVQEEEKYIPRMHDRCKWEHVNMPGTQCTGTLWLYFGGVHICTVCGKAPPGYTPKEFQNQPAKLSLEGWG